MCETFYGSADKKRKYIKKWVESKIEFKKKKSVANICRIISGIVWLVCIIVPTVLLIGSETFISGMIAGVVVGFIFATIPFFIGRSVQGKAFLEYGTPFVHIERECLRIYEDGVEYLYHYSINEYPESMNIYRIPIENMNAVLYDEQFHIITIIGEGELLAYDDYAEKRLNHQNSQRKFYSNTPYSIIAAFEDEMKVVQLLKNMAKNK